MTTCLTEITEDLVSGAVNDYLIVNSGITIPITFSPTIRQKLYLATNRQETIVCSLVAETASLYTITFFRLKDDRSGVINVGGVTTSESITNFQKDLTPGEYYICFSASFETITGSFKAIFSGFIPEIRLPAKGYTGEYTITDIKLSRRERVCTEPMIFELVSGELPPGCVLQPDGRILGTLPNLDCITDYPEYSPSINWFYEDHDNRWRPIPKRWRFRARVKLVNFPHVTHEEDFSIDVYNDWSKDKAAFMEDAEKEFDRHNSVTVQLPREQVDVNQFKNSSQEDSSKKIFAQTLESCSCDSLDISRDIAFAEWYLKHYPNTKTPEIVAFVENFKKTQKFKQIMRVYEENTTHVIQSINTAIQTNTLLGSERSTNDIDYLFLETSKKLNMMLPSEALGYAGEELKVLIQ